MAEPRLPTIPSSSGRTVVLVSLLERALLSRGQHLTVWPHRRVAASGGRLLLTGF